MNSFFIDDEEFPSLNETFPDKPNVELVYDVNQIWDDGYSSIDDMLEDSQFRSYLSIIEENQEKGKRKQKDERIRNFKEFLRCRIGYQLPKYREDLREALEEQQIGEQADFILAPIAPNKPRKRRNQSIDAIPDSILPISKWQSKVAITIKYSLSKKRSHVDSMEIFNQQLEHALYLTTPVVIITCPKSDLAFTSIASSVNKCLGKSIDRRFSILFEVSLNKGQENDNLSGGENKYKMMNSWTHWNSLRSHLIPDSRIGICLKIASKLPENEEELKRWAGESVSMILVDADIFDQSPVQDPTPYLSSPYRKFLECLIKANSFTLSLVIRTSQDRDITNHLRYLRFMIERVIDNHDDELTIWNDNMMLPLQPLSTNLHSDTYRVFEMDRTKYDTYHMAILKALQCIVDKFGEKRKLFSLMVLGAGRGPLVDSMIEALEKSKDDFNGLKFKIYALDKNSSSVRSLRYKQRIKWNHNEGYYKTKIVESDMRVWNPKVKADIIVTELLGSFSDNELSPECIDGAWKFSTPHTISIPREYSSYLAPICSYKLHQKLFERRAQDNQAYDRIYVVKLNNYYLISEPQKLFKFEHEDLSIDPSLKSNERYMSLIFESKTNTLCHGFAGYFDANLFDEISLSTVKDRATPHMNSWFPAFVPLENPLRLKRGDKIVVHFWRRENSVSVWYQWAITQPERSRIYSQNGLGTAMSKFI